MANTFVQYNPDTLQVTAVIQGDTSSMEGYFKLKQPLPPAPADTTLVLRLNYPEASCFYDKSDEAYKEYRMATFEKRSEELQQENERQRGDIRDLQDMIMFLMMS